MTTTAIEHRLTSVAGSHPRLLQGFLWGLSVIGYALLAVNLTARSLDGSTNTGGIDALAYWTAGRRLMSGQPIYGSEVGSYAAFLYPPAFAQLVTPLTLLPFPLFVWLWRILELLCLRYIVRSWRNAGIAMILNVAIIGELEAANVQLVVGAALAAAIRGDSRWLAPTALTKLTSVIGLPAALALDRRGALRGMIAAMAVVAASILIGADLWRQYLSALPNLTPPGDQLYNIGRLIPAWVRFGLAAACAVIAIRRPFYLPLAVTLAYPILWFHSLSTLTAITAAFERRVAGRPFVREPSPG